MRGYEKHNPDPFPILRLKRVERPTTVIMEERVQRVDGRENGFNRAARGLFADGFRSGQDIICILADQGFLDELYMKKSEIFHHLCETQ